MCATKPQCCVLDKKADKQCPDFCRTNHNIRGTNRSIFMQQLNLLTFTLLLNQLIPNYSRTPYKPPLFLPFLPTHIIGTVVGGIENIFELRLPQDETEEAVSNIQGNRRAELTVTYPRSPQKDRVMEIWHTAQNLFQTLESVLKDVYYAKMPSCIKNNQRTNAMCAIVRHTYIHRHRS